MKTVPTPPGIALGIPAYCHPLLAIVLALSISGCSLLPSAYRIDIAQGNLLDEQAVAQLRLGMTPRQVQYLLGTPLIMDSLQPNRWDYFYSLKQGDDTHIQHHLIVTFTHDQVSHIDKPILGEQGADNQY